MPELRDYTVIIYPPPPAKDAAPNAKSYTVANPNRVTTVSRVSSPAEAAARAGVKPGGRALVVIEGRAFRRATEAPLEEVDEQFQPLPQAAAP